MASKLFGGMNLSEVAKQIKEKGDPSPYESSPTRPKVPAAELALTGRTVADGGADQCVVGGSEALPAVEVSQPQQCLVHQGALPGSD